ncbi:von Willebrand factor D and EGF domain-containing protein-like isoform X3 [Mercenaria mercenaria]|nr:von Willebrand factor D and EGF domain-containing protein-like isoform X3 [Mercenaria mercenaria]
MTACGMDFTLACELEYNVLIRKCGKEVQYYLKPTAEYSVYCFDPGDIIYDLDVPAPDDVHLGKVQAKPELRFKRSTQTIRNKHVTQYEPYIQFSCSFSNSTNYFYTVQWKVNDKTVIALGPSQNMDDLSLHEDMFKDVTFDFKVQCSVAVSSVKHGQQTQPVFGEYYLAGVKIYNSTVYLRKGRSVEIAMSSTLPIGCKYNDFTGRFTSKFCKDELRIYTAEPQQCLQETVNNIVKNDFSKCAEFIPTLPFGEKWDPQKQFFFKIVTSDMDYEDNNVFNLKLKFSEGMKHSFWRNKALQDVRVIVTDRKEYKEKICYSHVDPHMRTADGYYYEQQQEGRFVLYYNKEYRIEIQERTMKCNNNRATCTCGISIRAGKDVFIADRCGKTNYIGFSECNDGGILQVVRVDSYKYTVFTPIGTKITITLHRSSTYAKFMNIDIVMAPKDKNNVQGLCGNFDGDMTNDLVHSDGTISELKNKRGGSHHEDFANSWRVPDERTPNSRKKRNLESWANLNGMYCVCEEGKSGRATAEAFCSSTQYLDCTMKNSITKSKCHILNTRKRRSPGSHAKEMERLFTMMEPVKSHHVQKRQTNEDQITSAEASDICSQRINGSLAFTSYSHVTGSENPSAVIGQCMFDVKAGNDKSLADVHVDSVNTIVKKMMDEIPTYVETNVKEVQVFLQNSCIHNCSNRGDCSEAGECICSQYYHGADCGIDERDPPIITDIEGGGICDVNDGDECRCFYLRGDNLLDGLKCQIVTTEYSIFNEVINVTHEMLAGGSEDIFTGVCCIPDEKRFSTDMFARLHNISLSNDGIHYGEFNKMYVFDSTCQDIDEQTPGRPSFTLKNGFCFIENACIKNQSTFLSENNTCLMCDVSAAVTEWTETNLETCVPTTTTTTTTTATSSNINSNKTSTPMPTTAATTVVETSSTEKTSKPLPAGTSINATSKIPKEISTPFSATDLPANETTIMSVPSSMTETTLEGATLDTETTLSILQTDSTISTTDTLVAVSNTETSSLTLPADASTKAPTPSKSLNLPTYSTPSPVLVKVTNTQPTFPALSTDASSPHLSTAATSPPLSTDETSPPLPLDQKFPPLSTDATSPPLSTNATSPSLSTSTSKTLSTSITQMAAHFTEPTTKPRTTLKVLEITPSTTSLKQPTLASPLSTKPCYLSVVRRLKNKIRKITLRKERKMAKIQRMNRQLLRLKMRLESLIGHDPAGT